MDKETDTKYQEKKTKFVDGSQKIYWSQFFFLNQIEQQNNYRLKAVQYLHVKNLYLKGTLMQIEKSANIFSSYENSTSNISR